MDNLALMHYNRLESAFNFEGWQEGPECRLSLLVLWSPLSAAAAPSTESFSKAINYSVPVEFQPQRRKSKALAWSYRLTSSNAELQGLRAQLQQLQEDKQAALAQFQKLQNLQVVNTVLPQSTTANVQNTANTFAIQHV